MNIVMLQKNYVRSFALLLTTIFAMWRVSVSKFVYGVLSNTLMEILLLS